MSDTSQQPAALTKKSSDALASEAQPAPIPKKTVEEWATAKGLLPASKPKNRPGPVKAGIRGIAASGNVVEHNPNYWKFAAARAGEAWPVGFEMTEAAFDKAIADHTDLPHGS